jgi:hypothetical protein
VTLIEASAEESEIPGRADALIGCFGMEIYPFEAPLERLIAHLRPGASVAIMGTSWAPWWRPDLNLRQLRRALFFSTTLRGRRRPWRLLEGHCREFHVEHVDDRRRNHFIAWGTLRNGSGG